MIGVQEHAERGNDDRTKNIINRRNSENYFYHNKRGTVYAIPKAQSKTVCYSDEILEENPTSFPEGVVTYVERKQCGILTKTYKL